ncbi:Arm DNA-binding domain-containing protein [Oligella sp. MSHR50489EDL]|uniref:Arm DNA-binding domain-containing protein n=1 Tax=Oligella sp. MSHR50489EDL TaxID=3139409 RepID=UPI003D81A2EC
MTFRHDYRYQGRRKTLTIGRYGPTGLTLSEAREELIKAKRLINEGKSPSEEKQKQQLNRFRDSKFDQRFTLHYSNRFLR